MAAMLIGCRVGVGENVGEAVGAGVGVAAGGGVLAGVDVEARISACGDRAGTAGDAGRIWISGAAGSCKVSSDGASVQPAVHTTMIHNRNIQGCFMDKFYHNSNLAAYQADSQSRSKVK